MWRSRREGVHVGTRPAEGKPAGGRGALVRAEFHAHVQFENARHHDYGLGAIPILERRKFQRFGTVDEPATAEALLILDDPIAVAVLADTEKPGP
jgi:hypothetical protein